MKEAPKALAPMDFSTFVLSLGSSAMINLGEVPAPDGQKPPIDLDAAKQIIDILGLLQEKTAGNLLEAEEKLLSGLVYDLRIKFCDAKAAKGPPEGDQES